MADKSPRDRLRRKADRGFQGYPLGTIAFYGPDSTRATKIAVGIVHRDDGPVRELERWFADTSDIREDEEIGRQVLAYLQAHSVRTVVLGPGILGCPHEEGVDYPAGASCPHCPYWAGRARPV